MALRILIRADTAANWTAANPMLAKRELAYDQTNRALKVGDGRTRWNSLSYLGGGTPSSGPALSVLIGGTLKEPDADGLIDLSLKFFDSLDVPFGVREAVVAGAYVDGELQGAQPVGSQAKMEFVTKNDLYKYTRGQLGTLVWVRLAGIKK